MKRLMISGCLGRMGRLIAQEAAAAGFETVCGIDPGAGGEAGFPVYPSFSGELPAADVLIDFSAPQTLPGLLAFATARGLPCVLGTTGYAETDLAAIARAAASIPVFRSANLSRGVYVLRLLAAQAARMLPGFDIEIVEKHHNQKQDSPSGTALLLLDAVRAPQSRPVFGREGNKAKRAPEEIGVHAVRGGTVAGEHEVGFYGSNEILTLTHQAQGRGVFAAGALGAAAWLMGKAPGLYGMDDWLGTGQ